MLNMYRNIQRLRLLERFPQRRLTEFRTPLGQR